MSIVVIDKNELATLLQSAVATAIAPLQQQVKALSLKANGKPVLTVKEFATESGLSTRTVLAMCNDGKISFNQATIKGKITIPITELLKLQQC